MATTEMVAASPKARRKGATGAPAPGTKAALRHGMQTPLARPRHFSMIRGFHLADLFTLANAACGMGGVLLAMVYVGSQSPAHFLWAAAMAPAAFVFDVLDGRVARWRHEHSALGRELDSLADVDLLRRGAGGARLRRRPARRLGRAWR